MRKKTIIIVFSLVILLLSIIIIFNIVKKDNYFIKASAIDKNSPDVILMVYRNDNQIEVKAIYYTNGVLLCNGDNLTTNKFNIKNNDQMKVVLKNNKEVMVKVVMEE